MIIINKTKFGRIGENIACRFLKKNGYSIVEQNFYYRGGEIDIIAYDNSSDELCFIEVKTRSNINYGMPAEAVSKDKICNITKGMRYYLLKNKITKCGIRLDVMELYYRDNKFYINHIKQVI